MAKATKPSLRELFPGHYRLSDSERDKIWKDARIVLDTSAVLNLYRYPTEAAESFYDVLMKFGDRLWLPWQVGDEFHANRLEVVGDHVGMYAEMRKSLASLLESLENERRHPHASASVLSDFKKASEALQKDLQTRADKLVKQLHDDEILKKVDKLFDGRVGTRPTAQELEARLKEAKRRCDAKLPPGFMDSKKKGDRAFGDYLVWAELIELAKSEKTPIIFVTDDAKEDWWQVVHGETIGLLPELIGEFVGQTALGMLAYKPAQFTKYAWEMAGKTASPKALEQMESQSALRAELEALRRAELARKGGDFEYSFNRIAHALSHAADVDKFLDEIDGLPQAVWHHSSAMGHLAEPAMMLCEKHAEICACIPGIIVDSLGPGFDLKMFAKETGRSISEEEIARTHRLRRLPVPVQQWAAERARRRKH